jgi:uncharacterized protein YwqG
LTLSIIKKLQPHPKPPSPLQRRVEKRSVEAILRMFDASTVKPSLWGRVGWGFFLVKKSSILTHKKAFFIYENPL